MKQVRRIQRQLPVFLLVGILMLCLGFILVNCGKGPQKKVTDPNAGQFGVDLSTAPSGFPGVIFLVSDNLPSLEGKEFTVEAWVKRKTSMLNGGVFSREDGGGGVTLWVKDNMPKFAIRKLNPTKGTGTVDYIVESNVSIGPDTWHHLAGVLVNASHTHSSSTTPTVTGACETAASETPHLDIYVDGVFKNCASTWGEVDDTATGPQFLPAFTCLPSDIGTGSCALDTFTVGVAGIDGVSFINGIVDEVRFWTVARTPGEISACMNQELSLDGGTCGRINKGLYGYLRFNEGKGSSIGDFSGMGSASKEDAGTPADDPARAWDGGWVDGAPIKTND